MGAHTIFLSGCDERDEASLGGLTGSYLDLLFTRHLQLCADFYQNLGLAPIPQVFFASFTLFFSLASVRQSLTGLDQTKADCIALSLLASGRGTKIYVEKYLFFLARGRGGECVGA